MPLYLLEDGRRFRRLPLFCIVGKVTGVVTEKPKLRVCFNPAWAELEVSSGRHFNTFTSVREKKAFGPVSEVSCMN